MTLPVNVSYDKSTRES